MIYLALKEIHGLVNYMCCTAQDKRLSVCRSLFGLPLMIAWTNKGTMVEGSSKFRVFASITEWSRSGDNSQDMA